MPIVERISSERDQAPPQHCRCVRPARSRPDRVLRVAAGVRAGAGELVAEDTAGRVDEVHGRVAARQRERAVGGVGSAERVERDQVERAAGGRSRDTLPGPPRRVASAGREDQGADGGRATSAARCLVLAGRRRARRADKRSSRRPRPFPWARGSSRASACHESDGERRHDGRCRGLVSATRSLCWKDCGFYRDASMYTVHTFTSTAWAPCPTYGPGGSHTASAMPWVRPGRPFRRCAW